MFSFKNLPIANTIDTALKLSTAPGTLLAFSPKETKKKSPIKAGTPSMNRIKANRKK